MLEHGNYVTLGKSGKFRIKSKEESIQVFCFLGDQNEKMKNQIKQMMDVSRV